jgi:hypothetical protein
MLTRVKNNLLMYVTVLVVLGLLESFLEIMETSQSRVEAPHEINNNIDSKGEVLKEKRKISTYGDPFRQRLVLARMERERLLDPYHGEVVRKVEAQVRASKDVSVLSEIDKIRRGRVALEEKGKKSDFEIKLEEIRTEKAAKLEEINRLYTEENSVFYKQLRGENQIKGEVPTKRSSLFVELWNKIKNSWGRILFIPGVGLKVFPTFKDIGAIRAMEFYTAFERNLLNSRERSLGEVLRAGCAAWERMVETFTIASPLLVAERVFIEEFIRVSEIHREKAQESLNREMHLKYREVACFLDDLYASEELKKEVVGIVGNATGMEETYAGLLQHREDLAKGKASLIERYAAESVHLGTLGEGMRYSNLGTGGIIESVDNKIVTVRVDFRLLTICQETLYNRFGEKGVIKYNINDVE